MSKIPDDIKVTLIKSHTPFNCCTEALYTVRSKNPISEETFDALRKAEAFMYGQETGVVQSFGIDNETGEYVYICKSFCDSGD